MRTFFLTLQYGREVSIVFLLKNRSGPSYRLLQTAMDEFMHIEFSDEIDLHHFHPKDAECLIADFLDHARTCGYHRVRIIHGKGRSVIKSIVYSALMRHEAVAEFYNDAANWGATIVVMKENKR
jgi:DNA-nicking Smr family endonuclease